MYYKPRCVAVAAAPPLRPKQCTKTPSGETIVLCLLWMSATAMLPEVVPQPDGPRHIELQLPCALRSDGLHVRQHYAVLVLALSDTCSHEPSLHMTCSGLENTRQQVSAIGANTPHLQHRMILGHCRTIRAWERTPGGVGVRVRAANEHP